MMSLQSKLWILKSNLAWTWKQTVHPVFILLRVSTITVSCCITSTFSIDFLIHLVRQYNYRNVYLGTHYKHKLKLFSQTIVQYQVVQLSWLILPFLLNRMMLMPSNTIFFSVIKNIKQDPTTKPRHLQIHFLAVFDTYNYQITQFFTNWVFNSRLHNVFIC